jgi:hypothetical protein
VTRGVEVDLLTPLAWLGEAAEFAEARRRKAKDLTTSGHGSARAARRPSGDP